MEAKEAILAVFEGDPLKTITGQQIGHILAAEHSRGSVSRNLGTLVDTGQLVRESVGSSSRPVQLYRLGPASVASHNPPPEPTSGQQCDNMREKIEAEIAKREAEIALLRDLL